MILGRYTFLLTIQYATALSKKQCIRNIGTGLRSVESRFFSIRSRETSRVCQATSLTSVRIPARRMASTSKEDSTESTESKDSSKELREGKKNRLALERSPYLLQHATNPVNWYPWGDEAIELARKEDKIIFLSVGYSTCHWCHVMEKESFKNEAIAKIMNKYFINIKVDREERPDIDRIYMYSVQADTGHGGWPMSVFLTPNLNPIIGATYLPPEDMYGRPGFKSILLQMAKQWEEHKENMVKVSGFKAKKIQFLMDYSVGPKGKDVPAIDCSELCIRELSQQYEPEFGGFGGSGMQSTKFPEPVKLNFLLHMYARKPNEERSRKFLNMCIYTLRKIAYGGIHDHVGQGFARYSTDGQWHVPHFEKMLYDQAQLLQSYADAFVVTKDTFFAEIVDDIVTYVTRDLRHEEGGFYSAEDADSYPSTDATAKKEGAFYVWTAEEIRTHLADIPIDNTDVNLFDLLSYHFNILDDGNVNKYKDPHGELTKKNVFIMFYGFERTAEHFGLSVEVTKAEIKKACSILYKAREARPRPHLDDKIITSWNGLMITGMARSGTVVGKKEYIGYGVAAAKFIEQYLFLKDEDKLLHSCYRDANGAITQTSAPVYGFLEDYAFLIRGLLDLYEATLDPHWLEFAEQLQHIQDKLFWDESGGGYFSTTNQDPTLIHRLKDVYDGAEPSGNAIAAGNLLRLAAFLDRRDLKERAGMLFKAFEEALAKRPVASPQMISALVQFHDGMTQIYIAGQPDAKDTDDLLRVVYKRLIPGRVLLLANSDHPGNILLSRKNEIISKMKARDGLATAYVCRHHACSLPVTSPEELAALLDE